MFDTRKLRKSPPNDLLFIGTYETKSATKSKEKNSWVKILMRDQRNMVELPGNVPLNTTMINNESSLSCGCKFLQAQFLSYGGWSGVGKGARCRCTILYP